MQNILITSVGRRVSLVRAFQASLKAHFPAAKVFGADTNKYWSAACHVCDASFALPHVMDESYSEALLKLCKREEIGLVVPTIDTELLVLSQCVELFASHNIHLIVSDSNLIAQCRDKRKTNILFEKLGIKVPTPIDPIKPTFPIFAKPYDGSLSKGIQLIESPNGLTEKLLHNPKMMFMEYMDPIDYQEYTVDAYYDKKGVLKSLIPRKRVEVRGGEISKGITEKEELFNFLTKHCAKIEGARGCLTMQFFEHKVDKSVVGIEINPRFGGGFPLSYAAGGSYPEFLILEYLKNESIDYFHGWKANRVMLRYDAEIIFDDNDKS